MKETLKNIAAMLAACFCLMVAGALMGWLFALLLLWLPVPR